MSTLFEIVNAQKVVTNFLERDEFPPEFNDVVEIRNLLPQKVDGYKAVMDKLDQEAKYFKAQADKFLTAASSLKRLHTDLKERIKIAMKELGVDELQGDDFRFKLSNTKPKLKINMEVLPAEYTIQTIDYIADKEKIEMELNEGVIIDGAELEHGHSLRTYVNKRSK